MPAALDTITANATAAAVAGSAMAAVAGDSLTIRATAAGKRIWLLSAWVQSQTSGFVHIRSPRMHDNTQGYRARHVAGSPQPLFPFGLKQELFEQDTLIATLGEGAIAGDIGHLSLLVYYEDLPGVSGRFITAEDLKKRMRHMVTVENTIATIATGGYGGGEAINAEFDLLKANTDYALVGYRVGTEGATVAWRGADSGNLRVSGPADELNASETVTWFFDLAMAHNMALIPIFNSANRAGITIDAVQNEVGADIEVTSIFAELG